MSLFYGRDIIEKGIMTELELHSAFKTGEITALDPNNDYQPIDWEKPKAVFQEICKLADQSGKYYPKQVVTYSAGFNSDGSRKETRNPPPKARERPRLFRDEQKQDRIPEETLLDFLRNEWRQTKTPANQYDEIIEGIIKGWGATQEKRILLDAAFKIETENDLKTNNSPPEPSPTTKNNPTELIKDNEEIAYLPKLRLAVEAWNAVYINGNIENKERTAKWNIEAWLNKQDLSEIPTDTRNAAIKDIVKIANIDPRNKGDGGREKWKKILKRHKS